jgi:hypothetical protein
VAHYAGFGLIGGGRAAVHTAPLAVILGGHFTAGWATDFVRGQFSAARGTLIHGQLAMLNEQ